MNGNYKNTKKKDQLNGNLVALKMKTITYP